MKHLFLIITILLLTLTSCMTGTNFQIDHQIVHNGPASFPIIHDNTTHLIVQQISTKKHIFSKTETSYRITFTHTYIRPKSVMFQLLLDAPSLYINVGDTTYTYLHQSWTLTCSDSTYREHARYAKIPLEDLEAMANANKVSVTIVGRNYSLFVEGYIFGFKEYLNKLK